MKSLTRTALMLLVLALLPYATATAQSAVPSPAGQSAPSTALAATSAPTVEYTLPSDKLAKAKTLYDLGGTLRIVGTIWGFVVILGILYLGVVARFRDWAEKAAKYSFLQAMIVVPLFVIVLNVLRWPLDAYRQSIRLQYGLAVQHWGSWFGDQLKVLAIISIVLTVVVWFVIWRIRRSPRWWWFQSWLAALPFILFLAVIEPMVLDPLFDKFEPLGKTNPQLVQAIEKVTERGGLSIPPDRMFLMKASEKVTTLNAYVTGLGPSKRVVVWDTTIQKASTPETLFVYGHEMGHYVLNHVLIGLAALAVGLFIGLYVLYRIANWMLPRVQQRWHIRELGDWAVVPMLFLIFSVLGFIATPLGSTFSRQLEHNADVYGLEITHGINANSQEVAAHTFQVLGELSLSYPYPSQAVVFWYYDHPAIPDRVRFAHEYDPWSKGEAPKYVK
ncbi:MAG TPA: M48 family metallopeptidase [Candidatus Angelobacter sp.]